MRRLFIFIFPLLSPFLAAVAAPHPMKNHILLRPPSIRVLMAKNLENVTLYGKDLRKILHVKNDQKILHGQHGVKFQCGNKSLLKQRDVHFASLFTPESPIRFNDNTYLGQMHLWVNSNGQCQLVHEFGLEQYVETLLPTEMNKKWPVEVLKAQAVAARTYAIYKIQKTDENATYDLENSERDQVNGSLENLNEKTKMVQTQTFGEVLVDKNGKLGPVFYHASCGGRTLTSQMVWGNHGDGHISRPCPCSGRINQNWQSFISDERMLRFLTHELKRKWTTLPDNIDDPGERFSFLRILTRNEVLTVSKPAFRKYFGRVDISSNNFFVQRAARGFMINGKGKGHGVGMCQIGALDLSKTGMDYKKILAHYFPNHDVKKIY